MPNLLTLQHEVVIYQCEAILRHMQPTNHTLDTPGLKLAFSNIGVSPQLHAQLLEGDKTLAEAPMSFRGHGSIPLVSEHIKDSCVTDHTGDGLHIPVYRVGAQPGSDHTLSDSMLTFFAQTHSYLLA